MMNKQTWITVLCALMFLGVCHVQASSRRGFNGGDLNPMEIEELENLDAVLLQESMVARENDTISLEKDRNAAGEYQGEYQGNVTSSGSDSSSSSTDSSPEGDEWTCLNGCSGNGYCLERKCYCRQSWEGDDCSKKVCPYDCMNHGKCVNGTQGPQCECNPGYFGEACEVRGCAFNCHGNGYCHDQSCVCYSNFEGLYCEDVKGCPKQCNYPHGECKTFQNSMKCMCAEGFTGVDCMEKVCPNDCSGKGECDPKTGTCTCQEKYFDIDCSKTYCPNNCSSNGICDTKTGLCKCHSGYYGDNCGPDNCHLNCSSHGVCSKNNATGLAECKCQKGWGGVGCEKELCPSMCNEGKKQGKCGLEGCECEANWGGESCDTRRCPFDCTSPKHGLCDVKNDYSCTCFSSWTGEACSEKTCVDDCNFRGVCNNGTCECRDWWGGSLCEEPSCKHDCNNNGKCILPAMEPKKTAGSFSEQLAVLPNAHQDRARCECNEGWGGEDCSERLCPKDCNGRGVCKAGVCFCNDGYYGEDCTLVETVSVPKRNVSHEEDSLAKCSAACVHGKCVYMAHPVDFQKNQNATKEELAKNVDQSSYTCFCEASWTGPSCNTPVKSKHSNSDESCPAHKGQLCNGQGKCNNGKCLCRKGWFGNACQVSSCKNGCSNRGLCNYETHECACFAGWGGDDCSARDTSDI